MLQGTVRMLTNAAGHVGADHRADSCAMELKGYDGSGDDDVGAIAVDALMGVVSCRVVGGPTCASSHLVFSRSASVVRGCPWTGLSRLLVAGTVYWPVVKRDETDERAAPKAAVFVGRMARARMLLGGQASAGDSELNRDARFSFPGLPKVPWARTLVARFNLRACAQFGQTTGTDNLSAAQTKTSILQAPQFLSLARGVSSATRSSIRGC